MVTVVRELIASSISCGHRPDGRANAWPFEVFDKCHAPMRGAPSVTIQKRGIVSINGAAHALLNRATGDHHPDLGLGHGASPGPCHPAGNPEAHFLDPRKGRLQFPSVSLFRSLGADSVESSKGFTERMVQNLGEFNRPTHRLGGVCGEVPPVTISYGKARRW